MLYSPDGLVAFPYTAPSFYSQCLNSNLSGSTGSLHPLLVNFYNMSPTHHTVLQGHRHKYLFFLLRTQHDIVFQLRPLTDSVI